MPGNGIQKKDMPRNGIQKEDMPGDGIGEKGMPANGVQQKAPADKPRLTRGQIAQRAACELADGAYVNLGWGIPNLIASHLPKGITVYFHSENGILGMGRRAKPGEEDFDLVDAMKAPVTLIPGASFFHQADAHLMTRGGHLDVAVLGAFQVSEKGDLSNWKVPGAKGPGGIGGAMDIAAGARTLIVCMEHTTRDGAAKIVERCTYPLTCLACVDTIVTDLAVIDVKPEGLVLREVARGWTPEEVQAVTGAPLIARQRIPEMSFA
jgi:3-oxoacid CoA-transferase B subunit